MEALHFVVFITLVILNISSIGSSLRCQVCGPDGEPCSDDGNVTSVDCDSFADRCMTVSMTMGSNTMVIKNCAHSTMICQEQGQGYPCRDGLIPSGASCNIDCCEGYLCNQANSEAYNTTSVAGPSLRCQACGPDGEPCSDDGNVTSVDCDSFADRCMTVSMTIGFNTMVMKNCAHSTMTCQEQGQGDPCKLPASFGASCNVDCCEGDLCNQASSEANNTVVHNETNPVSASSFKCEACGPFDCDGDSVTSVDCDSAFDRCMTVSMTVGSNTMMMKNCAHSTMNCEEQSQYNPCNGTASLGGSCNITCCEGDMCNQASPAVNSSKPEVAASSLKCQSCGPGSYPCDGGNIPSIACDAMFDRCMTVSMTMDIPNVGRQTMMLKNCSHSTIMCQKQGLGYPCKKEVLPSGASCNIECCEGYLCNQASPEANSTTAQNETSPEVGASSFKCEKCGPYDCDGDNVTSVECGGFADRCMTISMTVLSKTMTMKNCALSKLNCEEQSPYNPCKQVASTGVPCNVECCEGDMCNKGSARNSSKPEVAGSLRCQTCGPSGQPCSDDGNVTSVDCDSFADRCMTISMTIQSKTMMMKNCAHSTSSCQENSQYNPCKHVTSFGGSCNIECCEGDMCNENSSQPDIAASSLKCQACGPDGEPCDGANVTSLECLGSADRCLTVSMTVGQTTMMVKNCGYSTLNCQQDSRYNPCKVAPIGASCNLSCCEGDMCNLDSPTTVAPVTTATIPPTPLPRGTEPPPAVVKGRFFKVNSSPVCFGSKNNEFGNFSVPSTGDLVAIKLVHLYGYVRCYSTAKWSFWGCGGQRVNAVITTSANDVILPPAEFSNSGHWATIPGYTSLSPELVLSVFSRPRSVTSGEELHLWYGEDFVDARESDNGGRVCSDVYARFI